MHKWVLVAAFAGSASATCYYPDGSNAAKDYKYEPCGNSTTTYSQCCYFGEGDKCLPNGLCNQPDRFDYRAACQNKDWSNCPEVCMDTDTGTWFALQTCGKNKYCCPPADGSDCCESGAKIYTLAAPDPSSDSGDDAESTQGSASDAADTTSDATNSGFQSVVRTTIVSSSEATGGSAGSNDDKKEATPVGAIAGGVVGGVAVIGFLILGGILLCRRRGQQPAASSGSTVVIAGDAGSNGSNGGDFEKDKPVVSQSPQSTVAEIEGSAGNVYTEVDSRAISQARFAVRQEAEEEARTPTINNKPAVYHHTAATEIEGSAGNVYTEADSQAISPARYAIRQQAQEDAQVSSQESSPRVTPAPVHNKCHHHFAEIEGSAGNIYTEADSQAISQARFTAQQQAERDRQSEAANTTVTPQKPFANIDGNPGNPQTEDGTHVFSSTLASPQYIVGEDALVFGGSHQSTTHKQHQSTSEVEGSPGNVYTEADSRIASPAHVTCTQHLEGGALDTTTNTKSVTKPQPLSEIEGSSGTVYTELSSQSVGPTRIEHIATGASETSQEHRAATKQHRLVEIEGTAGNLYTEVDSRPIRRDEGIPAQQNMPTAEKPSAQPRPSLQLTEVEGSSGNVYTEADSHPVNHSHVAVLQHSSENASAAVEKPATHQDYYQNSVEVDGTVAGQQNAGGTLVEQNKPAQDPTSKTKITATAQSPQSNLTEVEGSPGSVFTEVDSKPISPHAVGGPARPEAPSVAGSRPTSQQTPRPRPAEIDGGAGRVSNERGSRPISHTRFPEMNKLQEMLSAIETTPTTTSHLAEIEGRAGSVFTEIDSQSVSHKTETKGKTYASVDKTSMQKSPRPNMAEVEGSVGNVYTEVDSKPVHHPVIEGPQTEIKSTTKQTSSSIAEIEGSVENVYTEVDSKPIHYTHVVAQHTPASHQEKRASVAEVEGSAGRVLSEADSKAVGATLRDEKSGQENITSTAELPGQRPTLAEVEGSAGNIYTEADSQPVNRPDAKDNKSVVTHKTTLAEIEGSTGNVYTEVEGSAGNIYTEADSKPINEAPV
ncbi:hypothetical protein FALBO_7868 [Fusarium albosuccineum]|uniref:Uncharacterized protein n=1 Tax=Fusarium albosuccineum TaxID=1237068 RepID=A0A8H4L9C6_9HYPO|nr:hypothetical protein FALBO_7868 [Fusarium albosuccineum]